MQRNTISLAPAALITSIACAAEPPVASIGSTTNTRLPSSGGSLQ